MKKLNRIGFNADEEVPVDLSPMIDLVFLLLIFFMTSSTLITFLKDHRVELPITSEARVAQHVTPRVVLNVYQDGSFGDERGRPLGGKALPRYLNQKSSQRPDIQLQIRSDRRVAHEAVKIVLRAARSSGIEQVIFSTHTSE